LSDEESEVIGWFLSQYRAEFAAVTEECLSASVVHRLAEKPGLENADA